MCISIMVLKFLNFVPNLVHYIPFAIVSGCSLLQGIYIEHLPPYSSGLNLIVEVFKKIKAFIHHHCDYYGTTASVGIMFDRYEIVDIITPNDAAGYFIHAGYRDTLCMLSK